MPSILPAIIPLFCFAGLFLIIFQKAAVNNGCPWREAILLAAVIWGASIVIITEILSFFRALTFGWVLFFWVYFFFVSCFIYFLLPNKNKTPYFKPDIKDFSFLATLVFIVLFIILIVGLIAVVSPPNTGDSMTYHMGRVVHWIQNRSVAHYPTAIDRQLFQCPLAEFIIMHFQILSGTDRFANIIQWLSMAGSIIGVSLLAKELGAVVSGQIFASLVCATIPMGILQGSSTQNDYALSFWLVCFVYYCLMLIKGNFRPVNLLGSGVAVGLAFLTKGIAYIYVPVFLFWCMVIELKRGYRKLFLHIFIILFSVFLLNGSHYIRNFKLQKNPLLSLKRTSVYLNNGFSVSWPVSNLIRNLSLHTVTPWEEVNLLVEEGVRKIHSSILRVGVSDKRTTFLDEKFRITGLTLHEDFAANPVHFLLILLSIVLMFRRRRIMESRILLYPLALFGSFLLFCLCLKWQPWHSRLHLPFFVLFSPFIGRMFSMFSHKIIYWTGIVIFSFSLPWLFYNKTRPIIGKRNIFNTARLDSYFINRPSLKESYLGAADFIKIRNCMNIGLYIGGDDWEYPFWVLLKRDKNYPVRIEHINVKNESNFVPCAVISLIPTNMKEMAVRDNIYYQEWSQDKVRVFVKK